MTIAAAYIAWIGIGRQIRIGIISREEDRIDRILPGMRAAELKARWLIGKIRENKDRLTETNDVLHVFDSHGLSDDAGRMVLQLEKDLPHTDDAIRRELGYY